MKVKELKGILEKVPDKTRVRITKCDEAQTVEFGIKNVLALLELTPSPGDDSNKPECKLCIFIK